MSITVQQDRPTQGIAGALAQFHTKVRTIHKETRGQYGEYADLATVLGAVAPVLAECGLSVTQTFEPHGEEGGMFLVTTLRHEGGETINSRLPLMTATPAGRNNPLHAWGACVTYSRRYALLAMLNLAAGMEDDDGDSMDGSTASRPASKRKASKPKAKPDSAFFLGIIEAIEGAKDRKTLNAIGDRASKLKGKELERARKCFAERLVELDASQEVGGLADSVLEMMGDQGVRNEAIEWLGAQGHPVSSSAEVRDLPDSVLQGLRDELQSKGIAT